MKSKNGGISSYETWDWQQITDWILKVDERTILIAYGFILRCQRLLSSKRSYFNIPQLIIEICILFSALRERNLFCFCDKIEVLDDGQTIKLKSHSNWNTAVGNIMIDALNNPNMIDEWTFTNNAKSMVNTLGFTKEYFYGYHSSGFYIQNNCKFDGDFKVTVDFKHKIIELLKGVQYKETVIPFEKKKT